MPAPQNAKSEARALETPDLAEARPPVDRERQSNAATLPRPPVTTPDPDWLQFRDDLITHAPSLWAPVLSPRPAS